MKHSKKTLVDTIQTLDPSLSEAEAERHLNTVIQALTLLTNKPGNAVMIRGFGTFTRKTTTARIGRNPLTLEEVDVPASSQLRFKPSKSLRKHD